MSNYDNDNTVSGSYLNGPSFSDLDSFAQGSGYGGNSDSFGTSGQSGRDNTSSLGSDNYGVCSKFTTTLCTL
jgi:hypothetical protein